MRTVSLQEPRKFSSDRMQKVGLFETEHCFCDLYCFEPGQSQQIHAHEGADKIYVVLEGTGSFSVDGEHKELTPEAAVLAPAGSQHSVENTSAGRLVLLVFMAPNPNKAPA